MDGTVLLAVPTAHNNSSDFECENGTFPSMHPCSFDNQTLRNNTEDITHIWKIIHISSTCIILSICLLTLVAGTLVVVAFIKFPFVRTTENKLLLSLTCSDMLTVPGLAITNIVKLGERTDIGRDICRAAAITVFGMMNQVSTLALLTAYRLFCVLLHLRAHQIITKARINGIIIGNWVAIGAFDIFLAVNMKTDETWCNPLAVLNANVVNRFVYIVIGVPFLLTPVVYGIMGVIAHRHHKHIRAQEKVGWLVIDISF